jgi:hypothetical protein
MYQPQYLSVFKQKPYDTNGKKKFKDEMQAYIKLKFYYVLIIRFTQKILTKRLNFPCLSQLFLFFSFFLIMRSNP